MTQWIKTVDQMPEDGVRVLLAVKLRNGDCDIFAGYSDPASYLFLTLDGSDPGWCFEDITHWMPLPQIPA
jgi:hypothetical protein